MMEVYKICRKKRGIANEVGVAKSHKNRSAEGCTRDKYDDEPSEIRKEA
jgi:hypothetical protein